MGQDLGCTVQDLGCTVQDLDCTGQDLGYSGTESLDRAQGLNCTQEVSWDMAPVEGLEA